MSSIGDRLRRDSPSGKASTTLQKHEKTVAPIPTANTLDHKLYNFHSRLIGQNKSCNSSKRTKKISGNRTFKRLLTQ